MEKIDNQELARIITEASRRIRTLYGKWMVITYENMGDTELDALAQDIVFLAEIGVGPVVVHSGWIDNILLRMRARDKVPRFIDGMLVMDAGAMEVVEEAFGEESMRMEAAIRRNGGLPLMMNTRRDGFVITATKEKMRVSGGREGVSELDIGMTGKVKEVYTQAIVDKIKIHKPSGLFPRPFPVPIITPIGVGVENLVDEGEIYRLDSRLAASAVASMMGVQEFVTLTDAQGVIDAEGRVIPLIDVGALRQLIKTDCPSPITKTIFTHLRACLSAGGTAHIIDARQEHALLLAMLTNRGFGTTIVDAHQFICPQCKGPMEGKTELMKAYRGPLMLQELICVLCGYGKLINI